MPFAVFAAAFLLYSLLPTRNFNYADDSLRWAYQLTQSGNLISSHHLSLNGMRWLYRTFHGVGMQISPVTLLAIYSAFWGAAGLAFLYLLLRRIGFEPLAMWGALICGFSAGYWSYAIVGDVYAPSIGLLVVGLYFFYSALDSHDTTSATLNGIGATAAFVLMLMHHQALFVFVLGLVPAAAFVRKASVPRRIGTGLGVTAAVSAISLSIYAVAYATLTKDQRNGFLRFCAGYVSSFDGRPDQRRFDFGSLINTAAGEARAVVSTNVIFKSSEVAEAVQGRYPARAVYPFPYLVHALPTWLAVIIGLIASGVLLAVLYLFFRGLRAGLRERDLILIIFVASIAQLAFFTWWEGISDEFSLWTLPIITLIAVRGAASTSRPRAWLSSVAICLFVTTLAGSVALYRNAENDVDLVNDAYATSLGPNDFLVGFEDIQSQHRISLEADELGFEYFDIRTRAPHWSAADSERFSQALESAVRRGANIRVSPRFIYPPESQLAAVRFINPDFDSQRAFLLAKLRGMPRVDWLKPAVFLDGYFHLDRGQPRPS